MDRCLLFHFVQFTSLLISVFQNTHTEIFIFRPPSCVFLLYKNLSLAFSTNEEVCDFAVLCVNYQPKS